MTDQATKRPLEAIAGNIYQAHSYKPGHLAKVASVYGTDTESAESLSKRLVAAVNERDALLAQNQAIRAALNGCREAIEMEAAMIAYKAVLGVGEWESFMSYLPKQLRQAWEKAKAALKASQ